MFNASAISILTKVQAPLAYFAKGPLSRARACFQSYDEVSRAPSGLIAHLRSLILPLPTMDRKYRETIPELIKELPFDLPSEDDGAGILALWMKGRRSKKVKMGKDGLYPSEKGSIAQWWLTKDISNYASDTPESREEVTKSLLLEQRFRETQLQIILVLETLAIESSTSGLTPAIENPESQPAIMADNKEKAKKPKKPQDLDTILDLLVDRLSIWQSMTAEEKSERNQPRPDPEHTKKDKSSAKANQLHQFCVDVIIPL